MKFILCAAFLGFGTLVIFYIQNIKLDTLRQETESLKASFREQAAQGASAVKSDPSGHDQASGFPSQETAERLRTMVDLSFEMLLNPGWSDAQHHAFEQIRNKMILDLIRLNHQSAFNILNQGLEIPGISQDQRDRLIEGFVRIYIDGNPSETLRMFDLLPDYPGFTKQLIQAYTRTAIATPGQAVEWFEEQSGNGNPILGNPEIIRASLIAQSRIDPTRAVARMTELTDPETIKPLGHSLVIELRNTAEHLAFTKALEKEFAKSGPKSSVLLEIRTSFFNNLISRLEDWPFEEAVLLIEGCLTPERQLEAARKLLFFERDQDAGKWAGWLASTEGTENNGHPLAGYIGRWALSDPTSAMDWLEKTASGAARQRGIIGFANYMAEKDPRNGLRLLNTLPESEERSATIQRVRERWSNIDPAAEAEYQMDQAGGK